MRGPLRAAPLTRRCAPTSPRCSQGEVFVLLLSLLLVGCDATIQIDPDGYRCDVGNLCPASYACRDGVCRAAASVDPSCATVSCTTPPASSCVSATLLRTFAGRCVAGQCQYDPVDSTCATTCSAGACTDGCTGVACVTPPQPACTDPNTLRTFAQTGTCTTGTCSYVSTDTTCPTGCDAARCKGVDLCQGAICTAPPAATCVNGARRTFAAMGTCDPGTGVCTYGAADNACPNGCALGQCLAASLAFAQTGPRVHFAINGIDVAPGSSGNSALAVGNGGKLARWDGSMWTELATPGTNALHKVAFVTGTVAFAVGERSTVLNVRPTLNQVTSVNLSGGGNVNLVAVSGRDVDEVLIASDDGGWWRMRAGTWTNGSLPAADNPWTINAAFLDESLRERIVGSCGATRSRCVGYRYPSGATPNFVVDAQSGSPGFSAVGGGFDVASDLNPLALIGSPDGTLDTHSNLGVFSTIAPTPALGGEDVVGITAQAVNLGRDVFVLTSSKDPDVTTNGKGGLFRLTRNASLTVTSSEVVTTYFGEETLSPNEANGVLVAEVRRAQGLNNIFRRGVLTNEALDVGEDFIGASVDGTGALVLASRYGDLVVRRPTSSTFDFRRPPFTWSIKGLEARNGTGALLVGEDPATSAGLIIRVTASGFTTLATRANTIFNAVCRVSDTEGWAVGSGGAIYRITSTAATQVTSPTTSDLLSVDCAPGVGVAAGAGGTVLRLTGTTWSGVSPAFPMANRITAARLSPGGGFVAGDGFFFSFTAGAWTQLTAKSGLTSLVVRGPQEVYGAFLTGTNTEVLRFDGAAWGPPLLQVSGALGGGVHAGARVVWGGTLGAIVEAR